MKDSLQRRVEEVVKGQSSVKRSAEIRAPIPGMVRKVLVREGDEVKKGAPILTLDAMKLENEIAAPVDGTVRSIHVQGGSPVEKDQILVIIG
ncbi:MAG: hypothetical protein A2Z34_06230 [Planctomycetes bacterium RBG_16_59_8]|nr:MAG: hypothetical protein A2Z34_06230 [Planctomycetes bacterium RBG_16_59_8]